MKNILPIQFIMTANKKRKDGDNRELEVYLYTKNKKKQLKTIEFLQEYLKLKEKEEC